MVMTMTSFIMSFVYIILPIFFIINIWRNYSIDLMRWLLWVSSSGIYIGFLFCIGVWPVIIAGYYLRYVLLFLFIIATFRSFYNAKRVFLHIKPNHIVSLIVVGSVCVFQIWGLFSAFMSSSRIPQSIHLDFPLKTGEYYIAQGGNSLIMNHHYELSAQKYAIDVIKLSSIGLRCNKLNASVCDNYNIFGDTLYSPCNGKIVNLVNEFPDMEPGTMDSEHPAGNYLLIEMDESNAVVVLAHIMNGSYFVKVGDIVKKGQPLAKVGNSGNTSEPHLHMHVVMNKTGDLLFTGQGIPMKFNNRFLVRNDRIQSRFVETQERGGYDFNKDKENSLSQSAVEFERITIPL